MPKTTSKAETTDDQDKEHARRQREAARIHEQNLKRQQAEEGGVSAEPTTAEHAGKSADEPKSKKTETVSALGAPNGPKQPAKKSKK